MPQSTTLALRLVMDLPQPTTMALRLVMGGARHGSLSIWSTVFVVSFVRIRPQARGSDPVDNLCVVESPRGSWCGVVGVRLFDLGLFFRFDQQELPFIATPMVGRVNMVDKFTRMLPLVWFMEGLGENVRRLSLGVAIK